MRHLKLFEGYLDKYYQEIDKDEFDDLRKKNREASPIFIDDRQIGMTYGKSLKFPDKTLKGLIRLLEENEKNININLEGDNILEFQSTQNDWPLVLTEHIGDDYYVVWIGYGNQVSRFKCDQFEGVKKLFQDLGFIK